MKKLILLSLLCALSAITALFVGCNQDDTAQGSVGSGVLLHYGGREFLATANHVVDGCGYQPWIELGGTWHPGQWSTIGVDTESDVAVLKLLGAEGCITDLSVRYGVDGVTMLAQGVALGFPSIQGDEIDWPRWSQDPLEKPIPIGIPLLLSYNLPAGNIHYSGGYVQYGFSGGPVIAWVGNHASVVGIITHKGIVADGGHAGVVAFADIQGVEAIPATHHGHDRDEIVAYKPPPPQDKPAYSPPPGTMVTSEVPLSVVRIMCKPS